MIYYRVNNITVVNEAELARNAGRKVKEKKKREKGTEELNEKTRVLGAYHSVP